MKYINSAVLVNLQQLISSKCNTSTAITISLSHGNPLFSSSHWPDINKLVILSLENIKQGYELNLMYFICLLDYADEAPLANIYQYRNLKVVRKAFNIVEVWNLVCCHGNKNCEAHIAEHL